MAADGDSICHRGCSELAFKPVKGIGSCNAVNTGNGEVDSFKKLRIANDTADDDLVLKSKVAVVLNLEALQIVGAARLPEDCFVLMAGSLFPAQRLPLKGIALFVKQLDIQRTAWILSTFPLNTIVPSLFWSFCKLTNYFFHF